MDEATSLAEYYIALQSVAQHSGYIQGWAHASIINAIIAPVFFVFGLLSYKVVHKIMGGKVITRHH